MHWIPEISKLVPYKHELWNSKQFSHVDTPCLNNTAASLLTSNEVENSVKIALLLPSPLSSAAGTKLSLCTEFMLDIFLFPVFTWDTNDDTHHCKVTQFYSYAYWDEIQFRLDVLTSSSENPSLIQHTSKKITVSYFILKKHKSKFPLQCKYSILEKSRLFGSGKEYTSF